MRGCVDAEDEIAVVFRDWLRQPLNLPLDVGGVGVAKQRALVYRYLERLLGR